MGKLPPMSEPQQVKAYSYVRFSSPEQAKGDSLRRQLEQTAAYCAEHGLELDTSTSLRDLGLSAYKGDNVSRGNLGKFLILIEQGKVSKGSVLIIENLDRLSRAQIGDAVHLFMSILRSEVDIVTLTDKKRFNRASLNNPMELMLSIMTFYRSHDESAQKAYRARKTWENKRRNISKRVLTARCPGWLRVDPERGAFIEVEEAVQTVREIFRLSASGMGHHTIARTLNVNKTPPIGRTKVWHGSYVAKILKNRSVLGEFQPHTYTTGKRAPHGPIEVGYFPRIIDDLTFNAVQVRKANRAGKLGRPTKGGLRNLFSGIARCGYCGSRAVYVQKGGESRSLVCSNATRGLGCKYISYPLAELESSFLAFVKELDLTSILTPAGQSSINPEADSIRARIVELDRQIENITTALESSTPGEVPTSLVQRIREHELLKAECKQRLQLLQAQIAETQANPNRVQSLKDALAAVGSTDETVAIPARTRLAEAIRSSVSEISLFPAGRKKNTFLLPDRLRRHGPYPQRHFYCQFRDDNGYRIVFSAKEAPLGPASLRETVTPEAWKQYLGTRCVPATPQPESKPESTLDLSKFRGVGLGAYITYDD